MADKSKDTGTGGINIDGNVHTMDVGVPDAQGGAQGTYSSGDVAVDKTVKDISKPTRETFAKYLSKTTLGTAGNSPHGNIYPVGSGDATTLQETPLKDSNGNPVSPGPQNNEAKFAAGFNTSIASNNPAGIRRGLTTGTGPDGNTLLPSARNADGTLAPPIQGYTANTIAPNLRDYGDYTATKKSANLSGDAQAENLYDLHRTTDLATDGGTSSNVLDPTKSVSFAAEADLVKTLTTTNFFPVDSPVVDKNLKVFKLDSSAVLAKTGNTKSFADVSIGSSPPIVSKGNLKNKDAAQKTLPDGNALLSDASTTAPPGGDYVKFVSDGLKEPVKTYTSNAIEPNLNDYNTEKVVIPEYEDETAAPSGIKDINVTAAFAADGGTSKNVLAGGRQLPLSQAAGMAAHKTLKNVYPVDPVAVADLIKVGEGKYELVTKVVSSLDPLAKTVNSSYFSDVRIGVPDSIAGVIVNSKGNLARKDEKNEDLPTGNKLLPGAAKPAVPGGSYVKLSGGLDERLESYTTKVLDSNLYSPLDKLENVDDKSVVEQGDFFGPRNLHRPVPGPEDAGTFDNINKDPSKRAVTREVLFKKYVSEVTGENSPGGIGNTYSSVGEAGAIQTAPTETSTTVNGYPASPTEAQSTYSQVGPFGLNIHAPNLQSSYSDDATATNLSLNIRRGKKPGEVPDGNSLLNSKDDSKNLPSFPAGPSGPYVSAVLKKNRFSESSRFADEYLTTPTNHYNANKDFDKNSSFMSPDSLRMGASPGTDDATKRDYSFKRLAHIGTILQLKAAFELGSDEAGYNPNDGTNQVKMLLPGLGQAGLGGDTGLLSTELLNVENIIKNLTEDPIKETQLIDFGSKFEGTVNSVYEKFSGFTAFGMIALAGALVLAITIAVEVVGFFFNAVPSFDGIGLSKGGRPGIGTYYGGNPGAGTSNTNIVADLLSLVSPIPTAADQEKKELGRRFSQFFGIQPTRRSFSFAITSGIVSFFGLNRASSTALTNPGYVVVIARSVVRSAAQIVTAFKDLVDKFSSGTALTNVESIVGIFYTIKSSRFISTMNIFAQLGDNKGLTYNKGDELEDDVANDVSIPGLDAGRKISYIDAADDLYEDSATEERHGKSRLRQGAITKLAWSSDQAPSIHLGSSNRETIRRLVGPGFGVMEDSYPGFMSNPEAYRAGITRMKTSAVTKDNPQRISAGEVKYLESILDGEYLPFYFHDLRTNEILGFHAFLVSLNEDYSASYESTDAFGRVEPVRVYKGTQRKIGLSFIVAATDKLDFDSMWYKINKFVTLIYPQYTTGKSVLQSGGYAFIKPFSQQIGASPMIRLRVGNLFTTNYSRFNLTGIFGLFEGGATLAARDISGEALEDARKKEQTDLEKTVEIENSRLKGAQKNVRVLGSGLAKGFRYKVNGVPVPQDVQKSIKLIKKDTIDFYTTYGLVARVKSRQSNPGPFDIATGVVVFELYNSTASTPDENKKIKDAQGVYKKQVANKTIPDFVKEGIEFTLSDNSGTIVEEDKANLAAAQGASETTAKIAEENAAQAAADLAAFSAAAPQDTSVKNAPSVYADNIKQFMNPKNNSIVKSFESAGGKGLAGFIESMSFDWFSGVTWDNDPGRKAPKMCKITISFSPVHDISPGLDSSGRNRAPIYRLGTERF